MYGSGLFEASRAAGRALRDRRDIRSDEPARTVRQGCFGLHVGERRPDPVAHYGAGDAARTQRRGALSLRSGRRAAGCGDEPCLRTDVALRPAERPPDGERAGAARCGGAGVVRFRIRPACRMRGLRDVGRRDRTVGRRGACGRLDRRERHCGG